MFIKSVLHIDKVLRHAETKLLSKASSKKKDLMKLYSDFLKLEEHRLYLAHKAGEDGLAFCRKRASLITVVLQHMWKATWAKEQESGPKADPSGLALIAVGGFGRRELCPCSDIDLLFLYGAGHKDKKSREALNVIIEQVLYLLWDIGFKVGHSVRTLEEVITEGNGDLVTKTALLEARLLAGSSEPYKEFIRRFQRLCIEGQEAAFLKWRMKDQQERHEKYGGSVFVQEPQLKNGCGGLRDYQNLLWVARVKKNISTTQQLQEEGWLTLTERKSIDRGYDFILRLRNQLHYLQKRPGDILTLKLQGQVARAFGYPQKGILRKTEALMRDYYQHARAIYQTANLLAERLSGEAVQSATMWSYLPTVMRRQVKTDGFIIENKVINSQSRSVFSDDPLRMLRLFQLMQQHEALLSPDLRSLIMGRLRLVNRKFLWVPSMQEIFIDILRKKGKVGRILRSMHELGVLGRLVPEFAPLTCLVQHEFFHAYTADEHTLVCIEQLDKVMDSDEAPFPKYRELFIRCEQPEVLYLALLLHDVGKANNSRNHNEVSAQLATRFARRIKLKGRRLRNLIFLVDHHGSLSEFAQRRNLEEPETIREFARIVEDHERLDMLMLLTFADAQGTSSNNNWSGWKELLVWQLYHSTTAMLSGEAEFAMHAQVHREEVLDRVLELIDSGVAKEEVDAHIKMLPHRYIMCASEHLMKRHIEAVHDFFVWNVLHGEDVLKPSVKWEAKPNESHSEVVIVTWDRDLLTSKIAGAFAVAELNILSADVFTRGDNIVIDTFRVSTNAYEPVNHKVDFRTFEDTLAQSLLEEGFDFEKALAGKRNYKTPHSGAEFPTLISFDNHSLNDHSLLHVRTPDYIGLLYDITSVMAEHNITITHSRITTEKGAALDTFYLTMADDHKIEDPGLQQSLLDALKAKLSTAKAS